MCPDAVGWEHPGMPLGDVAGWVNVELTKNVAEIGVLRILQRNS
ncbi:hypothetical protein GCM10027597_08470 [Saccharopolyspora tripterygii]